MNFSIIQLNFFTLSDITFFSSNPLNLFFFHSQTHKMLLRYKFHLVQLFFPFLLRHWQRLMEMTGKNFDMNPETFTLENLFAMELHNYAETISDIVGSANKELSIEKSINEVVNTWNSLQFTVHK